MLCDNYNPIHTDVPIYQDNFNKSVQRCLKGISHLTRSLHATTL